MGRGEDSSPDNSPRKHRPVKRQAEGTDAKPDLITPPSSLTSVSSPPGTSSLGSSMSVSSPSSSLPQHRYKLAHSERIQRLAECFRILTATCSGCWARGIPMDEDHTVDNCRHDFGNPQDSEFRAFRGLDWFKRGVGCFGCVVPKKVSESSNHHSASSSLTSPLTDSSCTPTHPT